MPWYVDLGTADMNFTWQMAGGVGYGFGWGDMVLDYRYLAYDQGGDALLQSLALSGGRLGFIFRF